MAIVRAGYSGQRLMTSPDFASNRRQAPRATSMNSASEPVGDAATTSIGMVALQVLTCGFLDIPAQAKLRIKSPQLYKIFLLDGLPRPISHYRYVPFDPRSPSLLGRLARRRNRLLPGGTATYEHLRSTHASRWA